MTGSSDGLTPRQRVFVDARAGGATVAAAAVLVGVSVRQAKRMSVMPKVRAAIRETMDETTRTTAAAMLAGSSHALETLASVMDDVETPAWVKVNAARVWLETAFRLVELVDLVERVERLEQNQVRG